MPVGGGGGGGARGLRGGGQRRANFTAQVRHDVFGHTAQLARQFRHGDKRFSFLGLGAWFFGCACAPVCGRGSVCVCMCAQHSNTPFHAVSDVRVKTRNKKIIRNLLAASSERDFRFGGEERNGHQRPGPQSTGLRLANASSAHTHTHSHAHTHARLGKSIHLYFCTAFVGEFGSYQTTTWHRARRANAHQLGYFWIERITASYKNLVDRVLDASTWEVVFSFFLIGQASSPFRLCAWRAANRCIKKPGQGYCFLDLQLFFFLQMSRSPQKKKNVALVKDRVLAFVQQWSSPRLLHLQRKSARAQKKIRIPNSKGKERIPQTRLGINTLPSAELQNPRCCPRKSATAPSEALEFVHRITSTTENETMGCGQSRIGGMVYPRKGWKSKTDKRKGGHSFSAEQP